MIPRAVAYMVVSALGFSAMSLLVKVASESLPTGEIVLARAVVTLVVSYAMVRRAGLPPWGTNKVGLAFRGLLGFTGLTLYYLSLAHLPLADATTIHQTIPLLTSVIAWFILRERIGWATAFALACGIAGVTLIVHPTGTGLEPIGIAAGIGAALSGSMAYVTVRQLARTENALVIVFYFPLIAMPLAIPWAIATWVTPEPLEWLLLFAIGLTTQVGQVFLTKALVIETASRATSIGYIQVAFAMIWQWTVFSAPPTMYTVAGAALIILGTVAVARASRSATRSDTPA
ncbi:MAG: DMT family transporter [Deltaproteobacteria bacterium]|nr:DMT family transporter [Deltaproteobacteria bacterium]